MTEQDVERINRFVDLKSPESNKRQIKICIFLIVGFFMFFVSDSLDRKINLFTSCWFIFFIAACILIFWGFYLLRTLERRQIDFMLYWGVVGTYYSAEFFALGISIGIHDAHANLLLLILLEGLDIPLLLWLFWYRMQLFKGKKKIKGGNPNYKIMFPLILAFSLIITPIIKNSSFQTAIMPLLLIFLGYVESIHSSLFGNYYVAKKYINYIDLYEDGKKLSEIAKAVQRSKQPKH